MYTVELNPCDRDLGPALSTRQYTLFSVATDNHTEMKDIASEMLHLYNILCLLQHEPIVLTHSGS